MFGCEEMKGLYGSVKINMGPSNVPVVGVEKGVYSSLSKKEKFYLKRLLLSKSSDERRLVLVGVRKEFGDAAALVLVDLWLAFEVDEDEF